MKTGSMLSADASFYSGLVLCKNQINTKAR